MSVAIAPAPVAPPRSPLRAAPGTPPHDRGALRRARLFRGLDEETAHRFAGEFTVVSVPEATVLFAPGEPVDRLYLVLCGTVKLVSPASNGRGCVLELVGPGEQFGDAELVQGDAGELSAAAVSDAVLAVLPREALERWIERRPQISLALLQVLMRRLRRRDREIADLVAGDVPERIARQLMRLARRLGTRQGGVVHVPHGLTQTELGQLVGASRETVNKVLGDFAGRGWLRLEGRSFAILDAARLARRARIGVVPAPAG